MLVPFVDSLPARGIKCDVHPPATLLHVAIELREVLAAAVQPEVWPASLWRHSEELALLLQVNSVTEWPEYVEVELAHGREVRRARGQRNVIKWHCSGCAITETEAEMGFVDQVGRSLKAVYDGEAKTGLYVNDAQLRGANANGVGVTPTGPNARIN